MELKIPKRMQKTGGKKPAKGISFPTTKGTRFVLFLGDEGAILIHLKGQHVQSRQFVPDASQQNLREFKQTILKDPHAPLMLIVDNMDQSYVQQTLPPVSALSVNKLIKRRLERDFGVNDIKGAVLLGREKTGRKDWNFLMVALEKSPQLTVWLDFILDIPNRFLGIHLVSVETEILLKRLEQAIGIPVSKEGNNDEWKFFVSHNKVGGFRQVILRGGRIIFTRLAQPVGESSPEVIAGSIEQEMLSTIEYMKRLSFGAHSTLDIYIVASSNIKSAIDPARFNATSFHMFTPYEVAQHLHIEGAAQPTDQFGDVILAATIGSSKKHILKLSAPQTKRVEQYFQFIMYQRAAAALMICAALVYCAYAGQDMYKMAEEADALEVAKNNQQQALDSLRQDIKQSNLDVESASDLIDLYRQLEKERLSPLLLFKKMEPVVRAPVWIRSVKWSVVTSNPFDRRRGGLPPGILSSGTPPDFGGNPTGEPFGKIEPQVLATIMLEFPQEATDPKMFKVVSKRILADFRKLFKGYDVRYTSIPDEVTDSDRLEIRSDNKEDLEPPKSLDVELAIRGSLAKFISESQGNVPPADEQEQEDNDAETEPEEYSELSRATP